MAEAQPFDSIKNSSRPETPCVIRCATPEDAPAVERLYRELVSDPLICVLPEQVAELSASPVGFLLVIEANGAICGTGLLSICPDAMYCRQPFGVVENVVIAQAMRGRGFGRALFAHIEQLAITHRCTKLMLLSSAKREAAPAFFRRCGFADDIKNAFVKYRRQFAGS